MAVKIKLKRLGKIRQPQYRIVVADARTKRDGRAIEEIGLYHPKEDPSRIEVDSARAQYWLSVGAQPTDSVRTLLKVTGDWQRFRGEPGGEGTLRTAAPRVDRSERYHALMGEAKAEEDDSRRSRRGTATPAPSATPASSATPAPDPAPVPAPAADTPDAAPVDAAVPEVTADAPVSAAPATDGEQA